MKARYIASVLLFVSIAIISCSKDDDNPDDPQNPTSGSLFIKWKQGLIPGDDTVFLVKYDSAKHIQSIVDSTWGSTLVATYSSEGNLSSIILGSGEDPYNTDLEYNAQNQLTKVNVEFGPERYTYEYTNGVLSKKNTYVQTSLNSPALNLWRYFTYEVTNGNITNKKEYSSANVLLSETTFTYTNEPNIFKQVALLNFTNTLGLDDVANDETFFNKNLIASSSVSNVQTTYTYTYNSKKQLTSFVVSSPSATHTRMLSY